MSDVSIATDFQLTIPELGVSIGIVAGSIGEAMPQYFDALERLRALCNERVKSLSECVDMKECAELQSQILVLLRASDSVIDARLEHEHVSQLLCSETPSDEEHEAIHAREQDSRAVLLQISYATAQALLDSAAGSQLSRKIRRKLRKLAARADKAAV